MFLFSKLLSCVTQPMFWLVLWWMLALLLLSSKPKAAARMLWMGLLILGLLGFRAGPDAFLRPLENWYSVQSPEGVADHAGIIVLGGAVGHPDSFLAHGQVPLGDAAERMTVPVGLMRKYSDMELVFSGGEGRLLVTGVSESELAKAFYAQQGMDLTRIRFETRSRNTRENARHVAEVLGRRCADESWLLVTSASHMPRSIKEFEAVGCSVTPYPVDFRTGSSTPLTEYSLAHSLLLWQTALHEWLGLAVYSIAR